MLDKVSKKLDSEDKFDVTGKNIANKLRDLSGETALMAEKFISDILFEAALGRISRNTKMTLSDNNNQQPSAQQINSNNGFQPPAEQINSNNGCQPPAQQINSNNGCQPPAQEMNSNNGFNFYHQNVGTYFSTIRPEHINL